MFVHPRSLRVRRDKAEAFKFSSLLAVNVLSLHCTALCGMALKSPIRLALKFPSMEEHLSTLLRTGQDTKALTRFLNAMLLRRAEAEGWMPWRWQEHQVVAMLTKSGRFYRSFTIPKKAGGERQIDAPMRTLKLAPMVFGARYFRRCLPLRRTVMAL